MAEMAGMDRLPVVVQRCALPISASPGSSLFSEELARSQKNIQSPKQAESPFGTISEELKSLIEGWVGYLKEEGQSQEDVLDNIPEVKSLLQHLPAEWVSEITNLVQNVQLPVSLKRERSSPSAQLITAFILLEVVEGKYSTSTATKATDDVISGIHKGIKQLFPFLKEQHHFSVNMLAEQLEQRLTGQEAKPGAPLNGKPFLEPFIAKNQKNIIPAMSQKISETDGQKHTNRPVSFMGQSGFVPVLKQFELHVQPEIKGESTNTFVQEIEKIILAGKFSARTNGVAKLNIRLTPEHLGTLNIELISKNGELSAKIMTSSLGAKEMMESHIHLLKSNLSSSQILLDRVVILDQSPEQGFTQQGSNSGQQQDRGRPPMQERRTEEEFDDLLQDMVREE
ncbi:flagellar hook-length control protein FliK [Fictibacillus solisalsi]|nr:flagellar hook-length control protein FliK [Fictibacillus solisalsi]